MNLTAEQVATIAERRARGDMWKSIAWDLPGRPEPQVLRKRYVRAGGNPHRDNLPIILSNFRIAQSHYDWLSREAHRRRSTMAATLRSVLDEAVLDATLPREAAE